MSILYTDLGWTKGSYPSQGALLLFCLARVILLLMDSQSKFASLLPPSFRVASLWIVDSASTKYWLTTHESYISVTGLRNYKEVLYKHSYYRNGCELFVDWTLSVNEISPRLEHEDTKTVISYQNGEYYQNMKCHSPGIGFGPLAETY